MPFLTFFFLRSIFYRSHSCQPYAHVQNPVRVQPDNASSRILLGNLTKLARATARDGRAGIGGGEPYG